MQIRTRIKTATPETEFDRQLEVELHSYILKLADILNKGLKFEDNFNADIISVSDTGAINSENSISHSLKRVPTGFLLINTDKAASVYDSGTAWTSTIIYLKFNAANCSVKLIVF